MRTGLLAVLILAAAPEAGAGPPETNDSVIRPGLPDSWIPPRREPGDITADLPDPRVQEKSATHTQSPIAEPPPVGAVCAGEHAAQSPEHDAAFTRALLMIYEDNILAAIEALQASMDVAANKTELALSWQVLGDVYRFEGMAAEEALAREAVADLGCEKQ